MRTLLAVIFCGLAFAAASARADDLFVDNVHGDDARNGRDRVLNADLKGPVRSLARGLELARPGDRIVMADTGVPYRESVTVSGGRNNGLGSQPFVIEGNGAVLEGSDLVPPKAWEHFHGDLFRFRPPRCAVRSTISAWSAGRSALLGQYRRPIAQPGAARVVPGGWLDLFPRGRARIAGRISAFVREADRGDHAVRGARRRDPRSDGAGFSTRRHQRDTIAPRIAN